MNSTNQTLTARLLKGSSVILFFTILTTPIGYFIRMLYSQTLTIEEYGLFYSVLALYGIFSSYNDFGFRFSVSYFVPKFIKQKKYFQAWKVYKYDQIIEFSTSIIISLVLILFSKLLAHYYFKVDSAASLINILSIYFIFSSLLEALNEFFTGLQQELYYSSLQFFRLFLILIFSLLFWFYDQSNIIFYAISFSTSSFLIFLIYNFLFYQKNKFAFKILAFDQKLFSLMLKYAVPTLITSSIYTFITFTDTFFLTLFKGVKEVGIYNIIIPIASLMSIFLSPINRMLFPLVSHLNEGETNKINFLIEKVLIIIPFISFYFAFFIILFPKTPISLLFGQKWAELGSLPLSIIVISYLFSSLSSYFTTIINGLGKVNERLYASILIAVLSLISSSILTYFYGIIGAVIANSLVYLLSCFIFGKITFSSIKFKIPYQFYLWLLIFGSVIYNLIRLFNFYPTSWFNYLVSGIIYSCSMLLLGFILKVIDKQTLKQVLSSNETKSKKAI